MSYANKDMLMDAVVAITDKLIIVAELTAIELEGRWREDGKQSISALTAALLPSYIQVYLALERGELNAE